MSTHQYVNGGSVDILLSGRFAISVLPLNHRLTYIVHNDESKTGLVHLAQ